jgi:hypothetical protein
MSQSVSPSQDDEINLQEGLGQSEGRGGIEYMSQS